MLCGQQTRFRAFWALAHTCSPEISGLNLELAHCFPKLRRLRLRQLAVVSRGLRVGRLGQSVFPVTGSIPFPIHTCTMQLLHTDSWLCPEHPDWSPVSDVPVGFLSWLQICLSRTSSGCSTDHRPHLMSLLLFEGCTLSPPVCHHFWVRSSIPLL